MGSIKKQLPPHIYEASTLAYIELMNNNTNNNNQSILVSGESGAGKTTTVKILMSHLATIESTVHNYSNELDNNDEDEFINDDLDDGDNPFEGIINWWNDIFSSSTRSNNKESSPSNSNEYMEIPDFEYDVTNELLEEEDDDDDDNSDDDDG